MSPATRQPNKTFNEPNRRRSCSDSAIQVEFSLRRYPLPDWALPRSDYDVASCSSDDDHERVELDDRRGYREARRKKLKVRRRRAWTIGLDAYEVPRFCEVLTEHVRSVENGPLDADRIREDEGFFSALTAPYDPPSPSPIHEFNQCDCEAHRTGCPPGLCDRAAEQDFENDCQSDDDEPVPHPNRDYEVNHGLYTPSGKWERVRHRPIDGWETLMRIKVSPPLSVVLRRGTIGGNPITYISRLWNTNNVPSWKGFFSELALFASSRHLRPLQGKVAPHIINVYIEPGFVNVAMEPPHECFWIEASPDMPDILKHRCVEAFQELHAHGILHGDAELRHMLINADAKVTIIDFKAAATCVPFENVGMEEVGLRKATPEEFRLEMRRVKFKLDYDGARKKERAKHLRKKRGELRPEDVLDPPVDFHVLNLQWLEGCERPPTRFVVPGRTKGQVALAVKRFLERIREMERQLGKDFFASQEREPVSTVKGKRPDVPEIPAALPRPKLMIKLPPLSTLRFPARGVPRPVSLLPPLEISRTAGSATKIPGPFVGLLVDEEASLQPGPSTESRTGDKAVAHPSERELASLAPSFGLLSPASVIKTLSPAPITGHYDEHLSPFTVPSFDFPVGRWTDGELVHSSDSEDHKDASQATMLRPTLTTPSPTQCSTRSTFPIMRTFADVARKAIQIFGRIAKQPSVQSTVDPSQQQKGTNSNRRKRHLSESSASESSEYQSQNKRPRRSTSLNLSPEGAFSPQPQFRPIPRTWSLITTGQSRRTVKRKRELEGTSELVWNTEQELRRKRCKLSELSDLSDASSSETEGETTRDRTARLRRTFAGSITNGAALLGTLSAARKDTIPGSEKKAPPMIVRDYAYISHKVPKAPYVPHPPTENRMAAERAKHIRLSNAKSCLDAGLPYPITENQQGKLVPDIAPPPFMFSAETFQEKQERKRREKEMGVKKVGKVQRSFGGLKRKLDAQRAGASVEFEERLYAGWRDASQRLREKVTSKVRFSMENLRGDAAQSPRGGANSGVLRKMVRSVKETSSILKRPPPVKVFNYQIPWEDEDDDAVSPKVGPEPESWDRSGGFGMLGVWVKENRTKTEEAFREECALRVCESQRTMEIVSGEWQQEEERMGEVRRRELQSIGL